MKIANEIAELVLTNTLGWRPTLPDYQWERQDIEAVGEFIAVKLKPIKKAVEEGLEIAEDTGIPGYPGEKRRYSDEARMLKSALALLSEEVPSEAA